MLFLWDPSLPPVWVAAPIPLSTEKFRDGTIIGISLSISEWEPISGLIEPQAVFWSQLDYYPTSISQS